MLTRRFFVAEEFVGFEESFDLRQGRFSPIGSMDHIVRWLDREITANCSGGGFMALGGTNHRPHNIDRLRSAPDHCDHRRALHKILERREKWFVDMMGVMFVQHFIGQLHHFDRDQLQAFPFKPMDDFANKAALDGVGFDQDNSAFNCGHIPLEIY